MYYTAMAVKRIILHGCKKDNFQVKYCDIFFIFAQNIDCGNMFTLTGTHDLCFRAKIKKNNVHPCKLSIFLDKSEF